MARVSVNPNPKMILSTAFPSSHQILKPPLFSHLKINSLSRLSLQTHNQIVLSSFCFTNSHSLQPRQTSSCLGFSGNKRFGFLFNRQLRFCVNAEKGENGESKNNIDEVDRLARSESTMPERFRYLTKEAPDPPVRWPWFVVEKMHRQRRTVGTVGDAWIFLASTKLEREKVRWPF